MDQPIPPSEKKSSRILPILPFLLFAILLLGKKQNRVVLKSQIAYMMADREKDMEAVYQDLEALVQKNMFQSYGDHLFIEGYNEKVEDYPTYEAEITMVAAHIARIYGGEFVVWQSDNKKQVSVYGLGQNEIPNVDHLPYFGSCQELSKVGKAICAESHLHRFIYSEMKDMNMEGGVTVKATVNINGQLSDFEPIASSSAPVELVDEAMRITKKMPKWQPAVKAGEAVACAVHIPFVFSKGGGEAFYQSEIDVSDWAQDDPLALPIYDAKKTEQILQRLLRMCLYADSNKERVLRKIQLSKKVRQLLVDYPEQAASLIHAIESEAEDMHIPVRFEKDRYDNYIDIYVELEDRPEPTYSDEDKIYADLLEVITPYEKTISNHAELAIENALADLFWDFIQRFPEHINMAQAALQHACNAKKISTHTVSIQKEKSQVVIDLVGRKR
ncbi:MAG: energy transducer TonB [Bacteroidota bacterium]